MYYHFAILTLFWPVVGNEDMGTGLAPRSLCTEAAKTIQELAQAFSRLYTLRRAPAFSSHILAVACTALITIARDTALPITAFTTRRRPGLMPESFSMSISHAIGSLAEMAIFHKGAQQELAAIQQLVRDVSI